MENEQLLKKQKIYRALANTFFILGFIGLVDLISTQFINTGDFGIVAFLLIATLGSVGSYLVVFVYLWIGWLLLGWHFNEECKKIQAKIEGTFVPDKYVKTAVVIKVLMGLFIAFVALIIFVIATA